MKKGYRQLLAEAEGEIETLTVEAAKALVGQGGYHFVDIREPGELLREGMIPGAIPAPRGMLEFWVDPDSPYFNTAFSRKGTFVLYCGGGWRSALAAKALQDMGFGPVCHIAGGFSAWRKAGGPIDALAMDSEGL